MEKPSSPCMGRLGIAVVAAVAAATIGCETSGDIGLPDSSSDAGAHVGGAGTPRPVSGGVTEGILHPRGTQLVSAPSVQIDGVTTDGYAAYTDLDTGTVNVVSLAGGAPIALGIVDQFNEVFVKGSAVVFAPAATNLGVADLSVWTAQTSGTVVLSGSAAAFNSLVAVSDDGKWILFFDGVDFNAVGNLVIARTDGSARTRLVTGIDLSNPKCTPKVAFAGSYAIAGYCAEPRITPQHAGSNDAGSFDPGYPDAGPDGGPPTTPDGEAAIATVSTFGGPTWAQRTIATGVQSQFTVDEKGSELMVGGPTGLLWFPIDGRSGGTVIDAAGTHGDFVSDGGAIVYTTNTNELARSTVNSPSPTPLSSGIARVIATSPDENWVVGYLGLDKDTYTVDLYCASATTSGAASSLVPTLAGTTGGAYGNSFTADSSHAIFFTDLGPETGTLYVASLGASGAQPTLIAPNVYAAYATTGAKIVFNDNYYPDTNTADIAWVDATRPTSTTTLVSQAHAPFYMTPSKGAIVYSWEGDSPASGLWIMSAP